MYTVTIDNLTDLMNRIWMLLFGLFLTLSGCKENGTEQLKLDIGYNPTSLELFGEQIISTALYERDMAISPGGDVIIYTLGNFKQTRRCLVAVKQMQHGWSKPEILSISGKYQDIEPFFTPDGNRLYFCSDRPMGQDSSRKDYNIWYSDLQAGEWTEPLALDTMINTKGDEFYPSISSKGNLYFTATRKDGFGLEDILVSQVSNGVFQKPSPLDSAINSPRYEFNAYISPDEDLIIFSSYGREDGLGGGDLYFSRRNENGSWNKAENMGSLVNSENLDYCPFIDWERKNFYFTSDRAEPVEMPLTSVDQLRALSNNISNGYGNIYRLGLDRLEIDG